MRVGFLGGSHFEIGVLRFGDLRPFLSNLRFPFKPYGSRIQVCLGVRLRLPRCSPMW